MKKIIKTALLLMLMALLVLPAAAEEVTQITIAASSEEVKPGDEVTFTVTIDGKESCRYYGLLLEYDTSVYEMGTGECTISGAMLSDFDPERGFVVLNNKERVPQGVLGTFTLKVREDAKAGEATVTGTASVKSSDTVRKSAVTGASVKIKDVKVPSDTESTVPKQTEPSTAETTAPKQTEPSGSQNKKTPQVLKPTFTVSEETGPVQYIGEENAADLPVAETAENAVTEATVSEEPEMQTAVPQEETGTGIGPVIAIGAAVVCVLLAVVLVVKKRKSGNT